MPVSLPIPVGPWGAATAEHCQPGRAPQPGSRNSLQAGSLDSAKVGLCAWAGYARLSGCGLIYAWLVHKTFSCRGKHGVVLWPNQLNAGQQESLPATCLVGRSSGAQVTIWLQAHRVMAKQD